MVFALGSALFAGLTAVLAKVGVENVPSNLATLIRTAVIFTFLAVIVSWQAEWQNPLRLPHRSLVFIILSGLAAALSWMCYFRALQLGPASLVATVDKLSLAVALGFSMFFLKEKLNSFQWLGSGLIILGALIVTLKR